MLSVSLKVGGDEHATHATTRREAGDQMVNPVGAIDPRPLPVAHARYLDVKKILERSLPQVTEGPASSPAVD